MELLKQERDAFEAKVIVLEAALAARIETFKETQVELFLEQTRSHEQAKLYREMRDQKKALEDDANAEARHWQRALLRAHQEHVRTILMRGAASEHKASEAVRELGLLSLDQHLQAARRWTDTLEPAPAEKRGDMPPE